MKRVVVLGGAGLIGSHLCMRLTDAGYEVVCIDTADISISPLLAPYLRRRAIRYICHDIEKEPRQWNEERDYFFPIPTTERSLTNGALTQNPGWNDGLDF